MAAASEELQVPQPERDAAVASSLRGMFGRDGLYLGLWAVQIGAAALFTPVTTRVLGAGPFGEVAASIAVMQILVAAGGLSLQAAVQRQYAEPDGEAAARRLVGLSIVLSLVTWGVVTLTGQWWSTALGFSGFTDGLRIAVSWAAATAVTDAALGLLRSRDQLLPFATVSLLQSVAAEGVSLALVLGLERSSRAFLSGQLICQLAALAVALAVTRPQLIRRHHVAMARAAMRYSSALVPGALAAFVLNAADRLVVQRYLGPVQTGRYQAAYNVGSMPIILLGVLNTVWMPRVFALRDEGTRTAVLAASRDAVQRVMVPVLLGLAVAAPVILRLWTPGSYRSDRLLPVVAVVVVSAAPYAHSMSSQRVLLAAGRTWALAWAVLLAAAVNLVLNLLLVPVSGLMGSALATLISFVVLAAATEFAAQRLMRVPGPPLRLTVLTLTVCGAAVGSAFAPTSPVALAIRLVAGVLCLCGMVFELQAAGKGRSRALRTPARRRR